ncbi:MAG: hypothetical protein AUK47_28110 [Deltaproteobacteria bacterium CG2_30_63_29]|nr:MAG: hypothetical protein AUK47_28110 [Deltaproteobacteria bacterium CG2_30_63_29]PIW02316.1 MAG: hypothetical protein COW42_02195 [Deltaproteobacteria bacterium CG17_big_fil_post_rev_8_21_14_2_50_63_7]PJB43039.1 MAG: hypothetical protein CO108_10780 [Deltaproteobacteria bacterium CG_4_9_14_3_um_filter_63_12]
MQSKKSGKNTSGWGDSESFFERSFRLTLLDPDKTVQEVPETPKPSDDPDTTPILARAWMINLRANNRHRQATPRHVWEQNRANAQDEEWSTQRMLSQRQNCVRIGIKPPPSQLELRRSA